MRKKRTIPWWRIEFGSAEVNAVSRAIRDECISQGPVTRLFERRLMEHLGVRHVVATSSGSAAIAMSLMVLNVGRGDQVIVPNRGWIATANAVQLLGAEPVFADVEKKRPVLEVRALEKLITKRTKVIVPAHLNGRSVRMAPIHRLAREHGLSIVEDAAQALFSKNGKGYLGTQGDLGCFSLSMAKICSTGQGGFVVTNDDHIAYRLRAIRTHGVENVIDPGAWGSELGFNFRITDVQSSLGLVQLSKVKRRLEKVNRIHSLYKEGMSSCSGISIIPVATQAGEIPIYNEVLCADRDGLIKHFSSYNIETRPFLPNLASAEYFYSDESGLTCSQRFAQQGCTLPSGPGQKMQDIDYVVQTARKFSG